MRYFLVFLIGISSWSHLSAQFSERFGILSVDEIKVKECSFDPEASALVLLNEGLADYDNNHFLVTYNHSRVKILKKEGVEHANVSLSYYSDDQFETIDDIEAVTINMDEQGLRRFPRRKKNNLL